MFDKQKVINYIEDKHLSDGGYFFGKIEPSSGLDTYFAVKTLKLLDTSPKDKGSIIRFWEEEETAGNLYDVTGIFLAIETYKALDTHRDFSDVKDLVIKQRNNDTLLQKKKFTFSQKGTIGLYGKTTDVLFVEFVEKELENLYRLASLLTLFEIPFDKQKLVNFIYTLQNSDGGFGSLHGSQFSTTYYALMILKELKLLKKEEKIVEYLKKCEQQLFNYYLEDVFWLIESLYLVNQKTENPKDLLSFIDLCFRGGGFSRSINLGIPTLEYTYYAVTILRNLEKSGVKIF